MNVTGTVASFVSDAGSGVFSCGEVELVKRNILDCVGTMLAGSKEKAGEIVRNLIGQYGGLSLSGVVGGKFRSSPPLAALANGTMAHALDYDDLNWSMMAHPSASILPALLAAAEELEASGKRVIEAYLIGYEVEAKIGLAVNPSHYEWGWHTTSTLGTLGSVCAVSRLMGLDELRVRTALGIASSMLGGLRKNFGSMTKPFHAGLAAQNGILAAKLAKAGFSADQNILDGDQGFLRVFASGIHRESTKFEEVFDRLGNPWDIATPGTVIKPYPCCGGGHAAIDAMLHIAKHHKVFPRDVDAIECGVHYRLPQVMIHSEPRTPLEAKFSLGYCLAVALIDGKVGLEQFTADKIGHPAVRDLIKKVKVYVHPDLRTRESLKNRFADITVYTKDGKTLNRRVYVPRGNPQNPLSTEDVMEKFGDCTRHVLAERHRSRLSGLISDLENLEGIKELVDIMTFECL